MNIQDYGELVSIALTIPTIVLSAYVVLLWGRPGLGVLRVGPKNTTDWFILGVGFGFAGNVLDNAYWQVAWCAAFLRSEHAEALIQAGLFFNIVSRQSLGILAAYCHVRSFLEHSSRGSASNLSLVTVAAVFLGIVNSAVLLLARS